MGYTLKTAQYVNDFQCIGGKCTMNCCDYGWDIIWSSEELKKLKQSKHSDDIENLIKISFKESQDGDYLIKADENGSCPFHDKNDGLCKIQKEIGEGYLSKVCRNYPTCGTINSNILFKSKYISCPAVFDLIAKNEKACDVYIYGKEHEPETSLIFKPDTIDDAKNNPSIIYRNELFDFFYGILSNKKHDIHTSLIIGTLAAQTLSKLESESSDRIPEGISALSKQINSPALIKTITEIKPNYKVKLSVAQYILNSTSLGKELDGILSSLRIRSEDGNSTVNVKKYLDSISKFNSAISSKPFLMRNIVKSFYMCQLMPFADNSYSIFDNYAYFCTSVALVDFLGAAAAANNNNETEIYERFRTALCHVSHILCHNRDKVKTMVNYLKTIDCYSAGHLTLIVKQ